MQNQHDKPASQPEPDIQPIRQPAAEAAEERKEALQDRKEAVEEVLEEQNQGDNPLPANQPIAPAENPRAVQADQAVVKPAVRMDQNQQVARAALGMKSRPVEPGELTETEEKAARQLGEAEAEAELRAEARDKAVEDAKEDAKAEAKSEKDEKDEKSE
jgi:hypothetical protein